MDDSRPLSRKIIAFVLTLIALPVLFVGTCVPLGLFANGLSRGPGPDVTFYLVGLYSLIFLAVTISLAVRTKNAGIRWAIITLLGAVAAYAAWAFVMWNWR